MPNNQSVIIISIYRNDTLPIVKEMFQSIFKQSAQNFDILVQLDGSLNSNLENYLDKLHANHKITALYKRKENKGLAYSLNELITKALQHEYTYIFRMDADDIACKERIVHQLEHLESHPEVDLLGGWIEEFNTDSGAHQIIKYPEHHDEILHHMIKRNPVAHVTVAFRADFFERFGGYDPESKNEDFRLWVDAFSKGAQFHNLQEVLVKVRTNDAFYNRRRDKQRALEVMKIKLDATEHFGFGIKGYMYAVAHYLLFMAPGPIKQFIYKFFR